MSKMISRSVMPIGTSTSPVLRTLPTREKTFVPLLPSVPMLRNQSTPLLMISGTLAQVSTLLRLDGLSQSPLLRGVYVLGPRLPDAPFDGGHQRARLPGDEGPGAAMDRHVEVEARAQDVRAQKSVLPCLLQGHPRVLDGQWVLLPDVDVALVGADGVGADDQPFEDAVRVALEEAPVHVRAGSPSSPLTMTYFTSPMAPCGWSPT